MTCFLSKPKIFSSPDKVLLQLAVILKGNEAAGNSSGIFYFFILLQRLMLASEHVKNKVLEETTSLCPRETASNLDVRNLMYPDAL